MKVSAEHYLAAHRKSGKKDLVEKKMASDAILAKDPTKEEKELGIFKTFVLSPTGGEIHRGESVVDRISKPETLREKVARFERLAAKVRENRAYQYNMLQESFGPDTDGEENDFDFEDGDFVDEFGDVHIPIADKRAEIDEDDGEKSPAPKEQGDEKPKSEPISEPVEAQ
jgi:hypothetical protein